ncbi:MAG: prepilin peptidase [Candidatus Nanopelagicales bacterium]
MPTAVAAASLAVLGLVVGSFLNVVVWRVPRGESVVSPPSACPSCHHRIRARDNVPVVSWLVLRGRCRDCGARISARYPVVEAWTGALFVLVSLVVGITWTLPAWLYLAAVGTALALIDVDHHRLPDVIVLPSYVVAGLLLLLPAALDDQWSTYGRAWLAAAALFAFYFFIAFVYPAGMGFGDVKLAGVLGLYLGWLGWGEVIVGTFAAFLFGAVVGVIFARRNRSGRKTAIPFGPFMLLGVLFALLLGPEVVMWYTGLLAG